MPANAPQPPITHPQEAATVLIQLRSLDLDLRFIIYVYKILTV